MDQNCAYCMEGELVAQFGIKICELPSSKVYLFKEQSHKGRVIVAHKKHVSEITERPLRNAPLTLKILIMWQKHFTRHFIRRKSTTVLTVIPAIISTSISFQNIQTVTSGAALLP